MKDITHYFADTAKPNGTLMVDSDGEVQEVEPKKPIRSKRNRVKIKISRRSTDERVCNIIDNNNDMVDKTPSPFPKLKAVDKLMNADTPKKASLEKATRLNRRKPRKEDKPDEPKVLTEVNLIHDSSESNVLVESTSGKQKDDDNHRITSKSIKGKSSQYSCTGNKKKKKSGDLSTPSTNNESQNREDSKTLDGRPINEKEDTIIVDLTDDFRDPDHQAEESNAFQILMNNSRPSTSTSPTEPSAQDTDLYVKKTEEYKEKLKRSKEKLAVLADKKGYSKKKQAELEEGEIINKRVQNRIKLLTGENKKDNDSGLSVAPINEKLSNSNLFSYYSRTSMEMAAKNSKYISSVVVKADVHVSDPSDPGSLKKPMIRNTTRYVRKSKKKSVELSEIDSIQVIESEEVCLIDEHQTKEVEQQNKNRWSLRIKLQENETVTNINGDTSDEEIFSHSKVIKRKTSESDPEFKVSSRRKQSSGPVKPNLKKKGNTSNLDGDIGEDENINKSTKRPSANLLPPIEMESTTKFNMENVSHINRNSNENSISECDINLKRKTTEKLAPLFAKRRKPDPEMLERRRLFLQPDISEVETKSTDRRPLITILPFPRISHITQNNNTDSHTCETFRIPMKLDKPYAPILNTGNHKYIMDSDKLQVQQQSTKKLNKQAIQTVITELQEQCAGADKMWDTISLVVKGNSNKKSPKTRHKRGKLIDKSESSKESQNKGASDEHSTFPCKYRPKSACEVVGNEEAVGKLRAWLDGWRATLKENDGNSSDEFYSSDCSYTSSNENNHVAVLLGPHGSGKSASVYAVAEELGYTVLEVNASSRRTGKKLLKEFEEATKSHRIKKEKSLSLFKLVAKDLAVNKVPQNSLILLEDIDIIFEEDEGFISAAYQLASNTKRPIVMTCRHACPHLSKMAPQQNKIYFQNPTGHRVTTLFELISLAETGCRLPNGCLAELLQPGDLRKALLQLQYLLLSGTPEVPVRRTSVRNTLWCDLRYCIYKPAIKMNKARKGKKNTKVVTALSNTTSALNSISDQLDNIALISSLVNIDDSTVTMSDVNLLPSLSLLENYTSYSVLHSISADIADWIERKTISDEHCFSQDRMQYPNNVTLKRQLITGVDSALSYLTSFVLDRHIISLDYLPSIRTICRAEDSRFSANDKRGNRFFHYLNTIKTSSTSLRPNILAAACKALQEKSSEEAN